MLIGGSLSSWLRGGEDEEEVATALARAREAALAEDVRAAWRELAGLLTRPHAAQAFCSLGGCTALASVLAGGVELTRGGIDADDVELTRATLECAALCLGSDGGHGGDARAAELAASNAVQLARTPGLMGGVLAQLDPGQASLRDFYCRLHAAQVLRALAAIKPVLAAEAVLASPQCVVQLVGLLAEQQEALRSEALLALHVLARASPDVQRMVAFQGGFEHVFAILREEGFLEGNVATHTCLLLLASLLQGNAGNQSLFLEMGFLGQLMVPIQQLAQSLEQAAGSRQEVALHVGSNLGAALEVLVTLLAPPPGDSRGTSAAAHGLRTALLQQGALHGLAVLAVSVPAAQESSLRCLAALLQGGDAGLRHQLLSVQLPRQQQQQPQQQGPVLMAHVATSLGRAVTLPLGKHPASLATAAACLQLLVLWVADCSPAATAFLRSVQRSPFLVDAIRGSNACTGTLTSAHPVTRGLCCLLLGLCALYGEDASGTPSQQQLAQAMAQQIGARQVAAALAALTTHPAMKLSAVASGAVGGFSAAALPLEPGAVSVIPGFAEWLSTASAAVLQLVQPAAAEQVAAREQAAHAPAPPMPAASVPATDAAVAATTDMAPSSSGHIGPEQQPRPVPTTEQARLVLSTQPPQPAVAELQQQLQVAQTRIEALELEASAAAAAREAQERGAAAAQARADSLAADAAKLEAELADLSAAYSQLEHHANSLQSRVDELEQQHSTHSQQLEQRVAAARQEARQEAQQQAQQEADEAMADLLVCLGQEEAKVARLSAALTGRGVDVDALLAGIAD